MVWDNQFWQWTPTTLTSFFLYHYNVDPPPPSLSDYKISYQLTAESKSHIPAGKSAYNPSFFASIQLIPGFYIKINQHNQLPSPKKNKIKE